MLTGAPVHRALICCLVCLVSNKAFLWVGFLAKWLQEAAVPQANLSGWSLRWSLLKPARAGRSLPEPAGACWSLLELVLAFLRGFSCQVLPGAARFCLLLGQVLWREETVMRGTSMNRAWYRFTHWEI